ncbi:MAG: hypothetical protein HOP29_01605 [Phycisphaerales bacterium]|nr:hypothetical protein [Phycisphaerales bacterium]
MNAPSVDVLRKLAELRVAIRRRLIAFGVLSVLSGGCLSFLTVVTLDWLLELPSLLRLLGSTLFIVGCGGATLHWVIRPMQTRFTLGQVAGKLERQFPALGDRLSSTVSFLTKPVHASPMMVTEVVASTNAALAQLHLRSALTLRPVLIQAALLTVGVVALLTVTIRSPQWMAVGVTRYARPFEAPDWPRRVQIEPITNRVRVALGDSTTLRMRVTRGLEPDLRGVVHLVDADRRKTLLAMHRDADGEFRCTVDAVNADLHFWFQAGDHNTRKSPGRIEVVRRPAIESAIATAAPPDYAEHAEPIVGDLLAGPLAVVAGSAVTIDMQVSKPIGSDADGEPDAWLEIDDGRRIPLRWADDSRRALSGDVAVEVSTSILPQLVDRDGLTSLGEEPYTIIARPDRAPTVVVQEPPALVEVTPRGSVPLVVRVDDDFGVADVLLRASTGDPPRFIESSLLTDARWAVSQQGVGATIEHLWSIADLQLTPPATITGHVEAVDNFATAAGRGQVGTSSPLRINVVSESAFQTHIRDELQLLQRRIRAIRLDQLAVIDATRVIERQAADAQPASGDVRNVARNQGDVGRRIAGAADQLARVRTRMELNHAHDADAVDRVRRNEHRLVAAAGDGVAGVIAALGDARGDGADPAPSPPIDLAVALDRQQALADALRDVIRELDEWGDFQAVVNRTRDLFDRQQALHDQTARLAERTLGQRADELSADNHAAVRQTHRMQDQLAGDLNGLLERIQSLVHDETGAARVESASPDGRDPPNAVEQIPTLIGIAAAEETVKHMHAAADAIDQNRLAGAGLEQQAAQRGLREMLARLQERDVRRLMELAKRSRDALRAVAELRDQQTALRVAVREAVDLAAPADVLTGLAAEQTRLRQNAEQLARDLFDDEETAAAGEFVRIAAADMNRGERQLLDGHGAAADPSQAAAIDQLNRAVAVLEEQARNAAQAATQRMLAAVGNALEQIRDGQQSVNTDTAALIRQVDEKGRLDRAAARQAAGLARTQTDIHAESASLEQRLAETVVYRRVMQQVVEGMDLAREALDARRLDADLGRGQAQVLRRIDQLLRALRDARDLPPPDEFAESSGGGGDSADGSAPPVPGAAELLMIRMMQEDLLTETVETHAAIPADRTPSEQQLAAVESLGLRQEEITALTELVVANAER